MARTCLLDNDLYARVTDRIITALEAGTAPWVCPWKRDGEGGRPRNGASGHVYKGINVVLTGMSGFGSVRWYTFKQAQALGGHVKKGQKGTTVIYWSFVEPRATEPADGEQASNTRKIPVLRSYAVFNAEQIEWPEGSKHASTEVHATEGAREDYNHVETFIDATGAEIAHQGTRAFYSPAEDRIVVPLKIRFGDLSAYLTTVLHELAHWTGHESRLARNLKGRFGSESYAAEELVAELAAAFLAADLGIEGKLQHAEYIANWLTILKGDKRAIFTAARLAQEAADHLTKRARPLDLPQVPDANQEAA